MKHNKDTLKYDIEIKALNEQKKELLNHLINLQEKVRHFLRHGQYEVDVLSSAFTADQ